MKMPYCCINTKELINTLFLLLTTTFAALAETQLRNQDIDHSRLIADATTLPRYQLMFKHDTTLAEKRARHSNQNYANHKHNVFSFWSNPYKEVYRTDGVYLDQEYNSPKYQENIYEKKNISLNYRSTSRSSLSRLDISFLSDVDVFYGVFRNTSHQGSCVYKQVPLVTSLTKQLFVDSPVSTSIMFHTNFSGDEPGSVLYNQLISDRLNLFSKQLNNFLNEKLTINNSNVRKAKRMQDHSYDSLQFYAICINIQNGGKCFFYSYTPCWSYISETKLEEHATSWGESHHSTTTQIIKSGHHHLPLWTCEIHQFNKKNILHWKVCIAIIIIISLCKPGKWIFCLLIFVGSAILFSVGIVMMKKKEENANQNVDVTHATMKVTPAKNTDCHVECRPGKRRKKLNLKNSTFLTWLGVMKSLDRFKQHKTGFSHIFHKKKTLSKGFGKIRCSRKYTKRKNGPFIFGKRKTKYLMHVSKQHERRTVLKDLFENFMMVWKRKENGFVPYVSKDIADKKPDTANLSLQLSVFPNWNAFIYPVFKSLDQFFSASTSSDKNSQSSSRSTESLGLEIELLRVSTFSSFPNSNAPSTLMLAKAGFFYTLKLDTVECFHCHIQYSNWTILDDPIEVHKRISPSCEFICGQSTHNVPVIRDRNRNVPDTGELPRNPENSSIPEINTQNHDSESFGTTFLQQSAISRNTYIQSRLDSAIPQLGFQNAINSVNQADGSRNAARSTGYPEKAAYSTPHQKGKNTSLSVESPLDVQPVTPLLNLEPLGICQDRPRYPAYAVLSVRMSTFRGWPPTAGQAPKEMATAGFIFAGYSDYTRCFFCGGGLRNWEPEDDPWIEHARWFPRCAYVRQNKGDNFVYLVHQNINGHLAQTEAQQQLPVSTVKEQTASRPMVHLPDPSVQSVREMGYSTEVINQAFDILKKDHRQVTAQSILEAIFTQEETNLLPSSSEHDNKEQESQHEKVKEHCSETQGGLAAADRTKHTMEQVNISEIESLIEENRSLKERRQCKICLDSEATIAFVPCGHISCCSECAFAMYKCPICRESVTGTIKTYLA